MLDAKLFDRAIDNVFLRVHAGNLQRSRRSAPTGQLKKKSRKDQSMTTIFAMAFDQGILLAGDRKTSGYGYSILSNQTMKIHAVTSHSAICFSGSVGDGQLAIRELKSECEGFRSEFEHNLSTNGQANWLVDFFRYYWDFRGPYALELEIILAGVDPDGVFRMNRMGDDGYNAEYSDYCTSGSGGERATDVLDMKWRPNMTLQEAMKLAMEAQYHAGFRDSGSSPIQVSVPKMAIITKGGFSFLNDKTLERLSDRLIRQKRGQHV